MRRPFLLLLVLALVVVLSSEIIKDIQVKRTVAVSKPVAQPAPEAEKKQKAPERVGERITYDVILGHVRLGKAVFHYSSLADLGQKQVGVITFETQLTRFKDTEKIYSDTVSYLPLKVERTVSVWPKYEEITELYDQDKFTLKITKKAGGRTDELNFKKDSPIHNAILLPYLVRGVAELKDGWNFLANLPTRQFVIELAGTQDIKVPAGAFKAYRFTSKPERFEIWLSADERKIPLKIRGMTGLGYTLLMREYSPPSLQSAANNE